MRKIIYILLVFSFACKQKKVSVTDDGILVSPKDVGYEVKMFAVSGNVTHSNSYCGGARPSDAMLQEITAPKPLPNSTFHIRQGKENDPGKDIFLTFKTDENGNFSFYLPPGDYVIIEQNRVDSSYYHSVIKQYGKETTYYSAADSTCLNKWLRGSLFQFSVMNEDVKNISWDMHKGCWTDVPCVHYKGPYPP